MRAIDADIVCSRAKNHYSPNFNLEYSDDVTNTASESEQLKQFQDGFQPLHDKMRNFMYFS